MRSSTHRDHIDDHDHPHDDDDHPMPECFQPTVTVPGVPRQFQAEKSNIIFTVLIFILPVISMIIVIMMIMFTFLGFPVVGKLQGQVGVTGCLIDSAPTSPS